MSPQEKRRNSGLLLTAAAFPAVKSFYILAQEEMNKNIIWVRKTCLEPEKIPYLHTREMGHSCFYRQGETKFCFSLPGETMVAHFSGVYTWKNLNFPGQVCFPDPEYTLLLRTKLCQTGRNVSISY